MGKRHRQAKTGRVEAEFTAMHGEAMNCETEQTKLGPAPSAAGAWKKVYVSTLAEQDGNIMKDDEDDMDRFRHNHYDSTSLAKSADRDFEASAKEAAGIFFGLEVLDGDSYKIHEDPKTKQRVMVLTGKFQRPKESADVDKSEKSTVIEPLETGYDTIKNNEKRTRVSDQAPSQEENMTSPSKDEVNNGQEESEDVIDLRASKKIKKRKKKQKLIEDKQDGPENEGEAPLALEKILNLQTSWSAQTGGVTLHETLCASLLRQGFWSPTPIQAAALPASIMGRRNIVGAAPTGSGKTLAFLLPIGQYLLDLENQEDGVSPLRALILTPTRELAMQIQSESDKLLGRHKAGTLVGGLAQVKQIRVLQTKRPPIVVATPGRLWEMMSSREHPHLNDLSQIRFLVIDEADRMIQQGSFPQLSTILDAVQRANPMDDDDSDEGVDLDGAEEEHNEDRLIGLPGIRGEAKLVMLDDEIMAQIERQRGQEAKPEVQDMDEEVEQESAENAENTPDDEDSQEISLPTRPPVYRQTFVYSATLTLPASANFAKRNSKGPKGKKPRLEANVDGAIAEILDKSRAKGKTKVVDLSNVSSKKSQHQGSSGKADKGKDGESKSKESFRLPGGLTLQHIKCTQRHKDSHLYAYLMTTVAGSSGPCLVFCNSIAGVRRVGSTLKALGLDVRILHAQMQQRARFKAVELLQESQKRTVVVSTDVAARGLDIPSVASVVHYDTARTVDSFIHRSGRTARGVGPKAVGYSVSLVAPDEDKIHSTMSKSLNLRFEPVAMDGRLLKEAQERVNLASKVAEVENVERRSQRQNQWLKEKAAEAGLDVNEDLLDGGLMGGDLRDKAKLNEARKAQERLSFLLAHPMKTQRFGKFLSTNSALEQDVIVSTPNFHIPNMGKPRKRRRH